MGKQQNGLTAERKMPLVWSRGYSQVAVSQSFAWLTTSSSSLCKSSRYSFQEELCRTSHSSAVLPTFLSALFTTFTNSHQSVVLITLTDTNTCFSICWLELQRATCHPGSLWPSPAHILYRRTHSHTQSLSGAVPVSLPSLRVSKQVKTSFHGEKIQDNSSL